MNINIDGKNTGGVFKGLGLVSGNGSSRLLVDYKHEQPEKYYEIMNHIFGEKGMGITHLKLEMGSDINSSSGTEPCVKRFAEEQTDTRRGAGFIIAADAKKINPDLTLDMLYWSEPAWVTNSDDVYGARYLWYMENLTAAYEQLGLVFDYVSISRNERDIEPEWLKYFKSRIKEEKNRPYDFSKIKIIAADEENAWWIAEIMNSDREVLDAVDVIGSHYTSHSSDKARKLNELYGKELWFTEGSAPMTYAKGVKRFDNTGLSGVNGVLDIAQRICAMYSCGKMTMYEFQPVVAAYYNGVTYGHKHLICACEPWSGHYILDSGYYMALHFSRFFKKGMNFIDSACFFDGEKGGDGHALVNANNCYIAATDEKSGDYSLLIVNPKNETKEYNVHVKNITEAGRELYVRECRGSDTDNVYENYFSDGGVIEPCKDGDTYTFSIKVKPYSIMSVSTIKAENVDHVPTKSEIMPLPYYDDFSYSPEFVKDRGGMPKFMTDQGGAFEVYSVKGRNVLMQKITPKIKAMEWGATPAPTTNFGDDRWFNYTVSAGVNFAQSNVPEENYCGAGLRFSLASIGISGYSLRLYENGKWEFLRNSETKLSGMIAPRKKAVISLTAENEKVIGSIDQTTLFEYSSDSGNDALIGAGRGALYSSYNKNYFDFIRLEPIGKDFSVKIYDDTDDCFEYEGEWEHNLMHSFKSYKRTISVGKEGAVVRIKFSGNGFGVFGENTSKCRISAVVDGVSQEKDICPSGSGEIFFGNFGIDRGEHTVTLTVLSGKLVIDGIQIRSNLQSV